MQQSEFLSTAIDAAKAAQAVIQRYYNSNLKVIIKEDLTPVTEADVETERTIKALISERFPDHGFIGEELGRENEGAEYRWLIDPIDGTKSFVRQYPFFSTQIALMRGDELILGVSNAPIFEEMAWAEKGQGAFLNGEAINVSEPLPLDRATLSIGNVGTLAGNPSQWQALGGLVAASHRHRGYGDFYHYHLLAAGKIDLVIESDVNILDIAALSVIVQEAGGLFTDLQGEAPKLETTSVVAASSEALHQQALQALSV